MTNASSKKTTKRKATRKPMRRRRLVKPSRAIANTAKTVEYFTVGNVEANTAYEFVHKGIIPTINGVTTRSAVLAPAYGLYRMAHVQWKFTPRFDTYIPGANPGGDNSVEVPKLYWKINRFGDAPIGFGERDLQQLGCKPIRVDDKTITIAYKPSILLANAGPSASAQAGGSGAVKMTPWLSTDSEPDTAAFVLSTTEHYGMLFFVECASGGDATPVIGEMSCRIVYEFKTPRIVEEPAAVAQRALTKHLKVSPGDGNVVVRQAQGVRPDNWNLQQTPIGG